MAGNELLLIRDDRGRSAARLAALCREKGLRPNAVSRAIRRLKQQGVMAPGCAQSGAARPFAFAPGQLQPEHLIYRAGGADLSNVRLLFNLYPTLREAYLIDLGYTGQKLATAWTAAVGSRDVPVEDGWNIRYYNFTFLEHELAGCFQLVEGLTEEGGRPGRYQAQAVHDGRLIKLNFVRADARLARAELGIGAAPTLSLINLPGYFGLLPRTAPFIRAMAGDLAAGEAAIVLRSELSLPALKEHGLEITAIDLLSLFLYQAAWNRRAGILDVSNLQSWCILRKKT